MTSLRRNQFLQDSHKPFPPIPISPEDFIATGVNARPTFFGCDPSPIDTFPLVIYLPNAPPITGRPPVTKYACYSFVWHLTNLFDYLALQPSNSHILCTILGYFSSKYFTILSLGLLQTPITLIQTGGNACSVLQLIEPDPRLPLSFLDHLFAHNASSSTVMTHNILLAKQSFQIGILSSRTLILKALVN